MSIKVYFICYHGTTGKKVCVESRDPVKDGIVHITDPVSYTCVLPQTILYIALAVFQR